MMGDNFYSPELGTDFLEIPRDLGPWTIHSYVGGSVDLISRVEDYRKLYDNSQFCSTRSDPNGATLT